MPDQRAWPARGASSVRTLFVTMTAALACAGLLRAQSTDEIVRPVAARVAEWLPPRTPVTVQCINRSQAKEQDLAVMCRAFSREVQRHGYPIGAGGAPVFFTATESASGRLLVAHFDATDGRKVSIGSWAEAGAAVAPASGTVRVERSVLLQSANAVLDFAMVRDGSAIAVLEPSAISMYSKATAGWELARRDILPVNRSVPRDLRGRLVVNGSVVTVQMPGIVCASDEIGAKAFTCQNAESTWVVAPGVSVRWAANRNYLQTDFGPVYTVSAAGADRLAVTSIDGALRLTGLRGEPAAAMAGYGSDAAAIQASCGPFVVATRGGDAIDSDQLIPLDIRNGRLEPTASGLPTPGVVTALWPSDAAGEAHAVVRNATSGAYEISRVAIQCVQ